jgi:hypothetical protein
MLFHDVVAQMISEFEKIGVKPNAQVAQAISSIDTWTLLTGRCVSAFACLCRGSDDKAIVG